MRSGRARGAAVWLLIAVLALFLGACSEQEPEPAGSGLKVGDRAPGFELQSASGGEVSLDNLIEKRPVLLYFSMGPG